jgi:hypothetical protein
VTAIASAASYALAQAQSPNGVKTLDPPGAIKAEGSWSLGAPPYPPRTMVEVKRLFDDDIVEIDSIFYAPVKK